MITFIDTENGNAFDASSPYVFWFENGQSTNLNYVKKICVYSDRNRLTLSIDSPVFSVLNMNQYLSDVKQYPRTKMNGKRYVDLNGTYNTEDDNGNPISKDFKSKSFTGTGYPYKNNFVYLFYILASSPEEGEYVDEFTINDGGTIHTFSIGADFYNINEILQSNLENLEIKIPESIQKAIYETNLHEESNDNILLNRKHKELLMNYWDIVANKGSYESLSNSLKWFEWGDLVRIEELWKSHENSGEIYKLNEFQTQISDDLKNRMSTLSKTTMIGLYCAMQNVEHTTENNTVYKDSYNRDPQKITSRIHVGNNVSKFTNSFHKLGSQYPNVIQTSRVDPKTYIKRPKSGWKNELFEEEVPNLLPIVALWNSIDMSLKMTLLGNFYQTFFMPIHMDLIHSTIESWVFANAVKLLHANSTSRTDYIDCTRTFELIPYTDIIEEVDGVDEVLDRDIHKIRAHKTNTYNDTLFKTDNYGSNIKGVEITRRASHISGSQNILEDNINMMKNLFNGECGLIRFKGSVESDVPLYRERLWWKKDGEDWSKDNIIDDVVEVIPVDSSIPLDFYLRFLESGHYTLYFELTTVSSIVYTKYVEVDIRDNFRNTISLYRVKPIDRSKEDIFDILSDVKLNGLCFQLSDNNERIDNANRQVYGHEDIFICKNKFPLTHVVVAPLGLGGRLDINGVQFDLRDINDVNHIKRLVDDYWIFTNDRDIVDCAGNITSATFINCISKHLYKSSDKRSIKLLYTFNHNYKEGGVDELRFSPVFYNLVPIEDPLEDLHKDPFEITSDDLLYITPHLHHSKTIDDCHWEFKNMSTLESIYSETVYQHDYPDSKFMGDFDYSVPGGQQSTLFTGFSPQQLSSGYYNIILHYKEGEIQQSFALDSAFKYTAN